MNGNHAAGIFLWAMSMLTGFFVVQWFGQATSKYNLHAGIEVGGLFLMLFFGIAGCLIPFKDTIEKLGLEWLKNKHRKEIRREKTQDEIRRL